MWSPKAGSGTSVVAAALALTLARRGGARLLDLGGDQPALLGLAEEPEPGIGDWIALGGEAHAEALDRLTVEAAPGLVLVPRGDRHALMRDDGSGADVLARAVLDRDVPTVIDAGTASGRAADALLAAGPPSVLVVRCCYLALRRAVADERVRSAAGSVIVTERGRAISPHDVSHVLGSPVLTTLAASREIARAVDAGTLTARLPVPLARAARQVLRGLDIPMEAVA